MPTYREHWRKLSIDQKSTFLNKLINKFPEISFSTSFNWLKPLAPTTPKKEVCEWISDYFKDEINEVFPFYKAKYEAN